MAQLTYITEEARNASLEYIKQHADEYTLLSNNPRNDYVNYESYRVAKASVLPTLTISQSTTLQETSELSINAGTMVATKAATATHIALASTAQNKVLWVAPLKSNMTSTIGEYIKVETETIYVGAKN